MDNPLLLDADAAPATVTDAQSMLLSPMHEDIIPFKANAPRLKQRSRRKFIKSSPKRNSSFRNSEQWKPIGSFSMSTPFPYIHADVNEPHEHRHHGIAPKWMPVSPSKTSQFTSFPYSNEYSSDDTDECVDMDPVDATPLLSHAHRSMIEKSVSGIGKSKPKMKTSYSNGNLRPFIVAPPPHKLRFQIDFKHESNDNALKHVDHKKTSMKVKKQHNSNHEISKVKTRKRSSRHRSRRHPPKNPLSSMPRWKLTEPGKRGAIDGFFSQIQYLNAHEANDQEEIRNRIEHSESICTLPRWRAASPMRCDFLGRTQFQHEFESTKKSNRWEKEITKIIWDKLKMVHPSMYGRSLQSRFKTPFRVSPPSKPFVANS